MIDMLKKLKNFFQKIFSYILNYKYATLSYSQEGEDMILRRVFEKKKCGFYVDIGAHHPSRFSNTNYFYNLGWRGVNIDATPGSMTIFNKKRPRDINIEAAISSKPQELTYYIFNEPALNSFSKELSMERSALKKYRIVKELTLKTHTLESILDEHLPQGQKIDFITIDTENFDLEVLKSNNWNKYSPEIILVEILNSKFKIDENNPTSEYLHKLGYVLFAKCYNTYIYRDNV